MKISEIFPYQAINFEPIFEAIPLGQAMPYRRAWDPNRYKDIFMKYPADMRDRNGFRLYLPYEEDRQQPVIPNDLVQYLAKKNYAVSDYMAGLAKQIDGKRIMKIGKLITDDPEMLKRFVNDPQRSLSRTKDKLVCISRHPYDVAGASTDRGWTSCMELTDGINRHYLIHDVREGTIVAYLIHIDDKNIQNPISRLLIKPFVNEKDSNDILLVADKQYGTYDSQFEEIVEKWLDEINIGDKHGLYCLNPELYNDSKKRVEKISVQYIKKNGKIDATFSNGDVIWYLPKINEYYYVEDSNNIPFRFSDRNFYTSIFVKSKISAYRNNLIYYLNNNKKINLDNNIHVLELFYFNGKYGDVNDYIKNYIDNGGGEGNLDLSRCTSLTSLPEGLEVGGDLVLTGCTSLTSLPEGLKVGRNLSLFGCTSLTSLPEGLEVGGYLNLFGCTNLKLRPRYPYVKGQIMI